MSPAAAVGWRVFPWDREAREGHRWSPTYVPPYQTDGRFDLPLRRGGVLYLAEMPDHAVAEWIQGYRGHVLESSELIVESKPLALVSFAWDETVGSGIIDLCDPERLVEFDLAPDRIASRQRRVTQSIAAAIHGEGWRGLRWWSVFFGEWHTIVLFRDRVESPLKPGEPEPLSLDHPAVVEAAQALGIALARGYVRKGAGSDIVER